LRLTPFGQFMYVADTGSSLILSYTINPTTGGSTAAFFSLTGNQPEGIAVGPSGAFVYVGTCDSQEVYRTVSTLSMTTSCLRCLPLP
jgi:DNA-binding beta-propeller fold protein YncE